MTTSAQLKRAGIAIVLYTGWSARSLFDAWQHSPFDHWDVLAWLIWMIPVLISVREVYEVRLPWVAAALLTTFVSALLDLNLLKHVALALACAGLTAPRRNVWLWLPMALSWMPVLGWLLSKYGIGLLVIGLLRVGFAGVGTIGYLSSKR